MVSLRAAACLGRYTQQHHREPSSRSGHQFLLQMSPSSYRVKLKVTVVRGLPFRTMTAWDPSEPLSLPVVITLAFT